MELSQEKLREVYDACGGDVVKIAAVLGVSTDDLPTRVAPTHPVRRRVPPADVGHRPGWPDAKHIVAVRHVDGGWAQLDQPKIDKARSDYEAGTHEMCQGRDPRGWFVLFSIPRRKRCGARKFFHMEEH